jgi:hypothetical protein
MLIGTRKPGRRHSILGEFKAFIRGANFAHLATTSGARWRHHASPGMEHPDQIDTASAAAWSQGQYLQHLRGGAQYVPLL